MDHLPSFGATPAIIVPCLCTEPYDGEVFSDYPSLKGWNKEDLYRGRFQGKTQLETQIFFQKWLYFGTLTHILGVPGASFLGSDFVRSLDGEHVVTTEKLPDYIKNWWLRENENTKEQKLSRFNSVKEILTELQTFVLRYCTMESNKYHDPPTFAPLTPEISLSIMVLASSLAKATFHITENRLDLSWGNSALLVERMRESGWCQSMISTLTTSQQVHLMYYASTFGKPAGERSHVNCTDEIFCKADFINEKTYETRHRGNCRDCELLGPPKEKIFKILDKRNIPLVMYDEAEKSWKVEEHNSSVIEGNYVALSHVWADGLGNTRQNELRSCQISYIQAKIRQLQSLAASSRPLLWWCDTLCVPLEESHRKIALQMIRQTFQNAAQVLVLDGALMQYSSQIPTLEIYMRVKLSGWMRRLWTLEEGFLAKQIHFQMKDGTVMLTDIAQRMSSEDAKSGRFLYTYYNLDSFNLFFPFIRGKALPKDKVLVPIWKSMLSRSSTHQSDEAICLAAMTGVDLKTVLESPKSNHDQRMKLFLQGLSAIPLLLLFQDPPRLSELGFRWAPRSFLNCFRGTKSQPYSIIGGTGRLIQGRTGLFATLPGLVFNLEGLSTFLIGESLIIQPISENIFKPESPQMPQHLPRFRMGYVGEKNTPNSNWDATNVDRSRNLKKPAVLLGQSLMHHIQIDAVLVDLIPKQSESHLVCYFIAHVGLRRLEESTSAPLLKEVQATLLNKQEWIVN